MDRLSKEPKPPNALLELLYVLFILVGIPLIYIFLWNYKP